MKTEVKKIYCCEYCSKHMLSASAMSRHEKYCRNKPENKHKCFDLCRHLKRNIELIPGKDPADRNGYKRTFTCNITGEKMYSYLAEKKQTSYFGNPMNFEGLKRMPLECKDYQYMIEKEIEERFNVEI